MDRFKYGWMLVAVLWLCTPAQAQEFTMEQAVEHAIKGNPSVESKLLTLEQAKMNIGVAQSYFWPRVPPRPHRQKSVLRARAVVRSVHQEAGDTFCLWRHLATQRWSLQT